MKVVNTEVAYDYIRKKILQGEFPPGYGLTTEALAKEIGVSRTPVRDAFRKLEADGLVTIRPHLGASVKHMDLKEFCELCELRLALESHAAGLAARNHTTADMYEIRFALDNMGRLTARIAETEQEQPLLNELMREDVRFHIAIISAAKNDVIKREILRLHLVQRLVSGLAGRDKQSAEKKENDRRRQAVFAKHQEIYEAIARADVEAAKSLMSQSLQDLIDYTLRIMLQTETGAIARQLTSDAEVAFSG